MTLKEYHEARKVNKPAPVFVPLDPAVAAQRTK